MRWPVASVNRDAHVHQRRVEGVGELIGELDRFGLRLAQVGDVRPCRGVVSLLNRLLHHLDERDPEAMLLVYGDHGPFLSRNVPFADAPEFVVQDHYGALGGIHPQNACAEWFDRAQERLGYLTLLDAVHTVIRCLSGGESALRVTPREHSVVGAWQGLVPDGHLKLYSEFLYE